MMRQLVFLLLSGLASNRQKSWAETDALGNLTATDEGLMLLFQSKQGAFHVLYKKTSP